MMDRNKAAELPKLQCGFIDFVCTFVYKVEFLPWYLSCYFGTDYKGIIIMAIMFPYYWWNMG